MGLNKDAIECRLTTGNRRLVFRQLGFSINGQSSDSKGWVSRILMPSELGEGENGNCAVNLRTGAVRDFGSTNYRGDLYSAVMDVMGVDFPEALEWIVDVCGIPRDAVQGNNDATPQVKQEPAKRERKTPVPQTSSGHASARSTSDSVASFDEVRRWHERLMSDVPEARAARDYLTSTRAIDLNLLRSHRVGLARDRKKREGTWCTWWIIFPASVDHEQEALTSFKAFAFNPEARDWVRNVRGKKICRNAGPTALVALSRDDSDGPVIYAGGEVDAFSAHSFGWDVLTGTGGEKAPKDDWVEEIARSKLAGRDFIICFDGDEAGRMNAPEAAEKLGQAGLTVRIADLPDGKDVNDLLREGGRAALQAVLNDAVPFPDAPRERPAPKCGVDRPAYNPFPVEALPRPIRAYVRAAAKALPAPPAMVATPTLAALAGAVGSAAHLELKRGWKEPATLWTVVVAPSGSTKSPAFGKAIRPVYRRESQARDQHEKAMAKWAANDGDEADKPIRRRYRTGDPTPEAVVKILGDNPRGVLLARDELAAWIGSFDRYANGAADLQFWIEVWGGIQASRDRAGEGNTTVDHPAVSVCGTIQPGTLRDKLGEIHFDTGFASRLILVMPPPTRKRWTEADVTPEVQVGYERTLNALYGTARGSLLRLSPEAKKAWITYYDACNARLESYGEGPAKAACAKAITYTARLTLVLHLCRKASGETRSDDVDAASMHSALKIGKWLEGETLRVYNDLGIAEKARPPYLRFLRRLPDEFKTASAQQIAEQDDVPERTFFDWLVRLQEESRIEKFKRGHYRKL